MRLLQQARWFLAGLIVLVPYGLSNRGHAAITLVGSVYPGNYNNADPWNVGADLHVTTSPEYPIESVTIDQGSQVICDTAWISTSRYGSAEGASITVRDLGSELECRENLHVGHWGDGVLNIDVGGLVDVKLATHVGTDYTGSGKIVFTNGTLETRGLLASPGEVLGTGTINTTGLVSDMDVVFDQAHGLSQQIVLNDLPDQNITINLTASVSSYNSILGAGYRDEGSLTVADGLGVRSRYGYFGYHDGSNGVGIVSGAGSSWDVAYDVTVGLRGIGDLLIEDGARVADGVGYVGNEANGGGSVRVRGMDSSWSHNESLFVGNNGVGVVTVDDGGLVSSPWVSIGQASSSDGTILVAGNGSRLEVSGHMYVGESGSGTLILYNGAAAGSGTLVVGDAETNTGPPGTNPDERFGELKILAGSSLTTTGHEVVIARHENSIGRVTVSGIGSSWDISQELVVGHDGYAFLEITDGAVVSDYSAVMSLSSTRSHSEVLVTGPGSLWTHETSLALRGHMTISDGGQVVCESLSIKSYSDLLVSGEGSSLRVEGPGGLNNGSVGGALIIEAGARVDTFGTLYLADSTVGDGMLYLSGGTLNLNGGALYSSSQTHALMFTGGTLYGATALNTWLDQEGGTLAPADGIGTATVYNHDYNLIGGTLEIELGGENNTHDLLSGHYDINIAMTGTTLDLPARGPMAAGTYTILETERGYITGEFEYVTGIGMYDGLVDLTYTDKALLVTLNWDYVPGDLNADGFVGLDDIDTLLLNWNQTVAPADLSSGDITGDGYVGLDDLDVLLNNWNAGTPPTDVASLIPEPGVLSLTTLGLIALANNRKH